MILFTTRVSPSVQESGQRIPSACLCGGQVLLLPEAWAWLSYTQHSTYAAAGLTRTFAISEWRGLENLQGQRSGFGCRLG